MDRAGNLSTQLLRFGNTALINRRCRGKKRLGIGVNRVGEQQPLRGPFHNSSQIHDTQTVADVLDHAQIVCDEQIGEMKFILQIHKNVQDLSLNGHIQSRYRLIRYDKFRLDRQRPGYADALTLTTGKLMRIPVGLLRAESNTLQQMDRLLLRLRLAAAQLVEQHRICEDLHDLLPGIQGGIGILKDHLHLPTDGAHLLRLEPGDIASVEYDLAGLWLDQLDDGAGRGRLSASGLSHQAEHLALLHIKADIVDRMDHPIFQ